VSVCPSNLTCSGGGASAPSTVKVSAHPPANEAIGLDLHAPWPAGPHPSSPSARFHVTSHVDAAPDLRPVRPPGAIGAAVLMGLVVLVPGQAGAAYVALMAGQRAIPLHGTFNNVPVLHSNQPEEVEGQGILINTAPGGAMAENGQWLRNAEFTFNGNFGIHIHHKYKSSGPGANDSSGRRRELTLAAVLINPGLRPVQLHFSTGAVRNSFEAPYLANNLMGVKPLGPRPWNTGPGDATAVQLLRGKLDPKLERTITIPARSRIVLFQTQLPALGIANALLRGQSDGPFHIAVVAAGAQASDGDILATLDGGRLAPGRVYLNRIAEINNRSIFSRVGGVALGDHYQATLRHDLQTQGPLHVPLTSTVRNNFGTREIQVNPLATRMMDSSLDNVGTYGVRFDIDLNLRGQGPYQLVMSHPSPTGGRSFTAFRGSLQIRTAQGLQEVHVGLRSGQSLALTELQILPGSDNPIRVSLVYPADATPGHLLSVVPSSQLALVQHQERQLELARLTAPKDPQVKQPPPALPTPRPAPAWMGRPLPPPPPSRGLLLPVYPSAPRRLASPRGADPSLVDRYRQAIDAQQQFINGWRAP